jgi:hypothetical protein
MCNIDSDIIRQALGPAPKFICNSPVFALRAHASCPQRWTSLHRDLVGYALAQAAVAAMAWRLLPRRRYKR